MGPSRSSNYPSADYVEIPRPASYASSALRRTQVCLQLCGYEVDRRSAEKLDKKVSQ
jgi:hypothetical protein